jgi:hypothetical protein
MAVVLPELKQMGCKWKKKKKKNCKIPGQGYFQAVHSQEKETFWHQNLQTV